MRTPVAAGLVLVLAAAACSAAPAAPATTVEVFGPWRGVEADRFEAALRGFEDDTGIDVRYTGSSDLAADLQRRVNDARSPDVAVIPQQGLARELADMGAVASLPADVEVTASESILPEVVDLAALDGGLLGVPYRLSVKGLVWYDPELFAAHGWRVPHDLGELALLTRRIQAAGIAPWCAGIEAFGATGWVMTDWVEAMVLRQSGPRAYDDWVAGDLAFTDAAVADAFDLVDELLLQRGRVLDSTYGLLNTPVDEAVLPLLDDQPRCAMHHNGSFTMSWLPDGTQVGPDGDVDVFVLPPADADDDLALNVGVDLAVPMNRRDATTQLLAYLASPDGGRAWAEAGGYLGGHIVTSDHGDPLDARLAELIDDARVVRADASDEMPPAFGADAFWGLMTDWAAGVIPTSDVLEDLDAQRAFTGA